MASHTFCRPRVLSQTQCSAADALVIVSDNLTDSLSLADDLRVNLFSVSTQLEALKEFPEELGGAPGQREPAATTPAANVKAPTTGKKKEHKHDKKQKDAKEGAQGDKKQKDAKEGSQPVTKGKEERRKSDADPKKESTAQEGKAGKEDKKQKERKERKERKKSKEGKEKKEGKESKDGKRKRSSDEAGESGKDTVQKSKRRKVEA